jgi:membrane protease YdiL (CAAX protease family)
MRAFGVALALLLAVYIPTFALVSVLHLTMAHAVPVIIVVSATLALVLMLTLRSRTTTLTLADFGLRWCSWRTLFTAIVVGLPFSWIINELLSLAHEPGPLAGMVLAPALGWFYFGLDAPLQEELIFRGLLQTALRRCLTAAPATTAHAGVAAVIGAAVLFALVHLAVGPWTAAAALALGLLAGELRRRSGSLVPAALIHIIFNLPGLLIAFR